MGYYQNLIIARQVEEPDRNRKGKRRETYRDPEVITTRRTLVFLLGSAMFFGATSVVLTVWVAWLV
mgnify:CR=1 FL=1